MPSPATDPSPENPVSRAVNALAEDFSLFDGWEERYAYLIDLGKRMRTYPESERHDVYLVRGCQSRVWLQTRLMPEGSLEVIADSDALIVKGLLAALCKVCSGQTPEDVASFEIDELIRKLGFDTHLTPARNNGFRAAGERIRAGARAMAAAKTERREASERASGESA